MRPDCSAPTFEPEREVACLLIPGIILDYLEAYVSILGHYETQTTPLEQEEQRPPTQVEPAPLFARWGGFR